MDKISHNLTKLENFPNTYDGSNQIVYQIHFPDTVLEKEGKKKRERERVDLIIIN